MTSIDERVVKITFDNQKFGEKIRETLSMLEGLKEKLNLDKATASFNKIESAAKSFDISSIGASVDEISRHFDTMGVAGTAAITNITNFAMQKGKQLLSALTSPIIEGGKRRALNIENAKFQIEGLGYTWDQVSEDINYGVLDTAYGLDSAAKAAGQLLASSVQIGPQMKQALRGISGVAAMTNSSYDEIAHVFTTVAGNGRLYAMQLNQLSAKGINVAATLGKQLGKSEAEIRDMVSKGKIDFQTFAAAMDDAFGAHAKEANKTFSGALSNMKAAMSRIGANFATPAYEHVRTVITALTKVFNGFNKALAPIVESSAEGMRIVATFINDTLDGIDFQATLSGPLTEFNRVLVGLGKSIGNLATAVGKILLPIFRAFTEYFGGTILDIFARASEGLAKFTEKLIISDSMADDIFKTFRGLFTLLGTIIDLLARVAGFIASNLATVLVRVFGFFLEVVLKITAFLGETVMIVKSFIDSLLSLQTVQDVMSLIVNIFSKFREIISKVYTAVRRLAVGLLSKAFETALFIFSKLAEAILFIATFIDRAVQKVKELIKAFLELPFVQRLAENISKAFAKIKDILQNIGPIVKRILIDTFNKFLETAGKVINVIKDIIGNFIELPTLEEVIEGVKQFMNEMIEGGKSAFEILGMILDRFRELTKSSFANVIRNFVDLGNRIADVLNVSDKVGAVKSFFKDFQNNFGNFASQTANVADKVKGTLVNLVKWIKTKFASVTLGEALAAGAGASILAFMVQMTRLVGSAKKLTDSATGVLGGFKKITDGLAGLVKSANNILKTANTKMKMEAVTDIIKSVTLLAGAIAVLASMDQERVKNSAIVIGVLAAALIGLSLAATDMAKQIAPEEVAKATTMMLGIAGSIIILCVALKLLSGIEVGKLAISLGALATLMLEFVAFTAALGKIGDKTTTSTRSLLAISAAMLTLSKSLKSISAIRNEDLVKSIAVLSFLMTLITLLGKIETKGSKDTALGILGFAVALKIVVTALEDIANMDSNRYTTAVERIVRLMSVMALAMYMTKYAGKYAKEAGVAAALCSAGLYIVAQAMKKIAEIDPTDLQRAEEAVVGIMECFALLMLFSQFSGEHAAKAGVSLIAAATALLILSGAMAIIAQIDPEGLQRAEEAVAKIFACFALIMAASILCTESYKTIITITACAAALIGAIAILSLIEPQNLQAASDAISQVLGMFSLLILAAGFAPKVEKTVIAMILVLELISFMLSRMADSNPDGALKAAQAINIVVVSLIELMGSILILGALQPLVMPGLLAFTEIIGVISGIMLAAGALVTLAPPLLDVVNNVIPLLESLGRGIGGFVGSIAGSFLDKVAYSLGPFGDALGRFSESLGLFTDNIKNFDPSAVDSLTSLVSLMTNFASLDFGNISKISEIAQYLPPLATALSEFGSILDDANIDKIHKGAEAALYLSEMVNNLPDIGLFSSLSSMPKFGDALIKFAKKLNEFGDTLDPTSLSTISSSIEPTKAIVEIANNIGNLSDEGSGFGTKMSTLSGNLKKFGKALKDYGSEVTGINATSITNSVEAARGLIEIVNMLEDEGGILGAFTGNNSEALRRLCNNLSGDNSFGAALKAYGDSVAKLNTKAINDSIKPTQALIDVLKSLDKEQGVINWFAGSTDIATQGFIENVKNLGTALVSFGKEVSTINNERATKGIDNAITIADALVKLSKQCKTEGDEGFNFLFGQDQQESFASFNNNISNLGRSLATFASEVSGIDGSGIDNALKIANGLKDVWNALDPSGGVAGFFSGDKASSMNSIIATTSSLGSVIQSFSNIISGDENKAGVTDKGIDSAIKILRGLVECFNLVEGSGGLASIFGGDKARSFASLAQNAGSLGEGIGKFAESVSGIDDSKVDPAIRLAKGIAEIYETLSPSGGLFDWGSSKGNSLRDLGSNLEEFGKGLAKFAESLKGEDGSDIDFSGLEPMAENLKKITDAVNVVTGSNIDSAKNMLNGFGDAYKGLNEKLSVVLFDNVQSAVYWLDALSGVTIKFEGFDPTPINALAEAIKNLADLAMNGTLEVFTTKGASLKDEAVKCFENALVAVIAKVAEYYDDFVTAGQDCLVKFAEGMANTDTIDTAATAFADTLKATIEASIEKVVDVGDSVANNIAAGIRASGEPVAAISETMQALLDAGYACSALLIALGVAIDNYIAQGIRENKSAITGALENIVKSMSDKLFDEGYHVGYWTIQGVRYGILDQKQAAVSAATEVMNAVMQVLHDIPKVESPSKVARAIGQFITIGLGIGILNKKKVAVDNTKEVANATMAVMEETLNTLSSIIENNSDYSPTITPIVDLSNAESDLAAFSNSTSLPQMNVSTSTNSLGLALGQMATPNYNSFMILDKLDKIADKIQNGSKSGPTVILDGITINDVPGIKDATKDYLIELARLGAM